MNELQKKRIKATFKYTWPFYILSAILVIFLMNFIFGFTHKTPLYKTLTIFVTGKVEDRNLLRKDLLEKFKDKDLRELSFIDCEPDSTHYDSKLSITGYNSADILIIGKSKLDSVDVSAFGIEIDNNLEENYYKSLTFYSQNEKNYGVKIDKEKVKPYMSLPEEDCYMILNGKSDNLGEYSKAQIKERDNALVLVKDWGTNV